MSPPVLPSSHPSPWAYVRRVRSFLRGADFFDGVNIECWLWITDVGVLFDIKCICNYIHCLFFIKVLEGFYSFSATDICCSRGVSIVSFCSNKEILFWFQSSSRSAARALMPSTAPRCIFLVIVIKVFVTYKVTLFYKDYVWYLNLVFTDCHPYLAVHQFRQQSIPQGSEGSDLDLVGYLFFK